MSESDESAVDSASASMGTPDVAAEAGDSRATRSAARAAAGRIPLTVSALVTQWSKLGFDIDELSRLGYDELSVRLAAGWPKWASQSELNLEDVVTELAQARQVLAERTGRHRSKDQGHGASQQADAAWVQRWAERLTRAGWMPVGDQSAHAVAYAIESALLDCDQVRKLAPNVGSVVVGLGILKIIT